MRQEAVRKTQNNQTLILIGGKIVWGKTTKRGGEHQPYLTYLGCGIIYQIGYKGLKPEPKKKGLVYYPAKDTGVGGDMARKIQSTIEEERNRA